MKTAMANFSAPRPSPVHFRAFWAASYRPAEYFAEHWDTLGLLDRYFRFFESCGWRPAC